MSMSRNYTQYPPTDYMIREGHGTWQCSFMAARSMIWKRLRRTVAGELMEVSSSSGWHLGRTCAHSFPTSAFPGSCHRTHWFSDTNIVALH